MAYNESLADRIRVLLAEHPGLEEKKMFGGICFMLNGKMACGIVKDELMFRVVPELYEKVLEMPHCREMDFTGRALKGFVYADPFGLETDAQLRKWLAYAVEFVQTAPRKKKS